jgi:hypothetical protein
MIHISVCLCCGDRVCKRCACCHQVRCDDQVRLCRTARDEKSGRHAHKVRGARRRLKGRMRTA